MSIQRVSDKIARPEFVAVLTQIYDDDFMRFSVGYRPNRSQHDALDALTCGISDRKVNWVPDLDIHKFFHTVEHDWHHHDAVTPRVRSACIKAEHTLDKGWDR